MHLIKGTIMPGPSSNDTHRYSAIPGGVITVAETIRVSESDFRRILELLDHSPRPNAKLRAAIAALPSPI
ncbi:DUF1778 domain-containing protein [Mesorhizobium sp. B1-1-5]|uniref:type II toxin -antitoxin system TacA 1-like antitoxin n=2 Tax=unclassified Mesorhizobium TaxID=325217 RepID=UPI0032B2CFD1